MPVPSVSEKRIAKLTLLPARFEVAGPPELLLEIQVAILTASPEEREQAVNRVYRTWFVECSVSSEKISLYDLRYWSVPNQIVFARPELIDSRKFGYSK